MIIYMIYLFVGVWFWGAQVIAVIALSGLAWRAQGSGVQAAVTGRGAATTATVLASLFTLLMVPVALMIFLRRHNREFPTSFTDPPGLACIAQVVLLVAAGVNLALVRGR